MAFKTRIVSGTFQKRALGSVGPEYAVLIVSHRLSDVRVSI